MLNIAIEDRKRIIKSFSSGDKKKIKQQRHLLAQEIVTGLLRSRIPLKQIDNILLCALNFTEATKAIGNVESFKKQAEKRNNGTCSLCGSNKNLEMHHIKPKFVYPELKYELDNIMFLCHECHRTLHDNVKTTRYIKKLKKYRRMSK